MKSRILSVAISAGLLVATGAQAEPVLQGKDAYGDWRADKPGTVRLIRPQDLVRPG
ncbi:sorbosone dehydrogenase family protein, partial [Bradyrhizobium sp. PRIMUS42]|nr:sorbosone dehydrogenase family protein [Bradyrhizobium sp. PRIMUS42]